jgi:hypothetical protein
VPLAAGVPLAVTPEITRTPEDSVSYPTLTPPAPETVRSESVATAETLAPVVFPIADRLCTVPLATVAGEDITTEPPDIPTLTAPAPSKLSERASAVIEDIEVVVFPTANRPRVCTDCDVAAELAEMTIDPPDMPTETSPAPSKLNDRASAVIDETEVVVLPTAKMPRV